MSRLQLDLTDRTFAELVEIGRALIPRFSPQWTDHNLHDPGITLLELLAWNTEAQIYSLGRRRRDERLAYAALLGVEPAGPTPATGIIWPNLPTRQQSELPWGTGMVIERGATVRTKKPDTPVFRTTHTILLTGARLVGVRTKLADGGVVDQTAANRRGGAAFQPFGPDAGLGDRLELEFQLPRTHALLLERADASSPPPGESAPVRDVCLALGIRAPVIRAVTSDAADPASILRARLTAHLVSATQRIPLRIINDSSEGLMKTGVLLLDISGARDVKDTFTIEIAPAARGIARPPRVLRIEPNALPVAENEDVKDEPHEVTGVVGNVIALDVHGLRYGRGAPALNLRVLEAGRYHVWNYRRDLSCAGPTDRVYTLDNDLAEIRFGNGVNGQLPPVGATVLVSYSACRGGAGNLPRNQEWLCSGVAGVFGKNLDAMSGGADALDLAKLRYQARQRVNHARTLVTNDDLTNEALALPLMDVARAHVINQGSTVRHASGLPATRTLVLLRARWETNEPEKEGHESARWLGAARRALVSRMPLGERLRIIAPKYVRIRIAARLRLDPMCSPDALLKSVRAELKQRIALVPAPKTSVWPFGRKLTAVEMSAWFSKIQGVSRVESCRLFAGDEDTALDEIAFGGAELPALDLDGSTIDVVRAQPGATR